MGGEEELIDSCGLWPNCPIGREKVCMTQESQGKQNDSVMNQAGDYEAADSYKTLDQLLPPFLPLLIGPVSIHCFHAHSHRWSIPV